MIFQVNLERSESAKINKLSDFILFSFLINNYYYY
jgi:hypothetical protein